MDYTHTQKGDNLLLNHIFDNIENLEDNCFDDLHYHLFNEDFFIIGYHKAEQFIKENDLNIFELIQYCQEMEKENFGEIQNTFDNAEKLVNHYAYWRGQELLYNIEAINKFDDEREDDRITKEFIKEVQNELYSKFDLIDSYK